MKVIAGGKRNKEIKKELTANLGDAGREAETGRRWIGRERKRGARRRKKGRSNE